jgi:hypothetical protein
VVLPLLSIVVGESCLLVLWCAGGRYVMVATMRIMAGVGDLVQRTRDGQAQVVYSVTGRTRGTLHHARGDEEHEFLDLASKPRSMVCQWFDLKTTGSDFLVEPQNQVRRFVSGLASKSLGQVSRFGSQNWQLWFVSGFASKPLGWVSRFGLKTGNKALVIWASKSLRGFPGLGLKTMRATVSLLCHKTDGRMKMVCEMRVGNNHVFALSTNLVLRFYCLFDFRNIGVKLEHFKKLQEHLEIHQI